MSRDKGMWCWNFAWLILFLKDGVVVSSQYHNKSCALSRCGTISNISYPFRLRDDPPNCGHPKYELACENNVLLLQLYSGTYRVLGINYNNVTVRIVDAGIQDGDCSSLPSYFLYQHNFSNPQFYDHDEYVSANPYRASLFDDSELTFQHVVYLNCSDPVRDDAAYLDTSPCVNREGGGHLYAVAGDLRAKQLQPECRVKLVAAISSDWESCHGGIVSYADLHRVISFGFEVSWWAYTGDSGPYTGSSSSEVTTAGDSGKLPILLQYVSDYLKGIADGLLRKESSDDPYEPDYVFSPPSQIPAALGVLTGRLGLPFITIRFLIGMVCLFAWLICKCRKRHLSMYEDIEEFLQLYNLVPIRYSYKELKKITRGFKNKLGEGGFGIVYKGRLRSGSDAAIKMLGKSKANNQEFISEVATIGRIHHFNVVRLIGFCVEGTKRALVYEYMSNGSLDKYIFFKEGSVSLDYHKIYEISLGIARGIAYFHHECDVQILHFDIKPHNILLDDNFVPKISDFGLAKLHSANDSITTLTAARGTIGYMAPELFYKNIGRVSYKADVYSFGMLLMEMASCRRNLNPHAEHSSQLYFPLWIYNQFDEKKDIRMEYLTIEEKHLARKMFIVALWCIQLKPVDRPSMNKVIEMLEVDDVERLEMPPKPSLYPDERVLVEDNSNSTTPITSTHSCRSLCEDASDGEITPCN